jgi:hypothetical protein
LLARGVGASRSAGFDARLSAGLTPHLSARAGLAGLFSGDEALSGAAGTYSARLLVSTLDLCAGPRASGRLQLDACAGLWAGRWRSEGAEFAVPLDTKTGWLSLATTLALAVRITESISAVLSLSLVVRPRDMQVIARDPSGAVVASSDVPGLGAALGIGLRHAFFRQAGAD